jgi:hypothetical protein
MKLRARIDRWKRKRRLKAEATERLRRRKAAAEENSHSPLREFVYLDEISVYSLIASRLGPIAAEFTDSQATSLREEVGGRLQGGVPGVVNSEVNAAVESQETGGSQIVRKSIIQATFRELIDLERDSLAISPFPLEEAAPQIESAGELETLLSDHNQQWIIDPRTLNRGNLLEVEVELEAEGIFRMGAIMTAFFEILEENPSLIDAQALGGLLEGVMANRMLDRLLVGLVPIRGRAIRYRHVTIGQRDFIVHEAVLENLAEDESLVVRPLMVVGVAEADLFWRDTRRVLFSRSQYTMMCRMGRSGVHNSWTPVKLVEVLKEVVPDLGSQIQGAGEMLERRDQLAETGSEEQSKQNALQAALVRYARDLAEHHSKDLDQSNTEAIQALAASKSDLHQTLEARRAAFGVITEAVSTRLLIEVNPMVAAQLRMAALLDSGLGLDGDLLPLASAEADLGSQPSSELRFLDTEIVAIYW